VIVGFPGEEQSSEQYAIPWEYFRVELVSDRAPHRLRHASGKLRGE
jgi:hypothetical protein